MYTDIDIPPPPIKKKSKEDGTSFRLYIISGFFYLPKGFLKLLSVDNIDIGYLNAINELSYLPKYQAEIYDSSVNVGMCYPTTKPESIKDGWALSAYVKSLVLPPDKVLEAYEFFLKEKILEINPEDVIINEEIHHIKGLIYFDQIQIREIHNKDAKKQIDDDFF